MPVTIIHSVALALSAEIQRSHLVTAYKSIKLTRQSQIRNVEGKRHEVYNSKLDVGSPEYRTGEAMPA